MSGQIFWSHYQSETHAIIQEGVVYELLTTRSQSREPAPLLPGVFFNDPSDLRRSTGKDFYHVAAGQIHAGLPHAARFIGIIHSAAGGFSDNLHQLAD